MMTAFPKAAYWTQIQATKPAGIHGSMASSKTAGNWTCMNGKTNYGTHTGRQAAAGTGALAAAAPGHAQALIRIAELIPAALPAVLDKDASATAAATCNVPKAQLQAPVIARARQEHRAIVVLALTK